MKNLILLTTVSGLGQKFDCVTVDDDQALNLLASRKAKHDTPLVRKQLGHLIRYTSPASL